MKLWHLVCVGVVLLGLNAWGVWPPVSPVGDRIDALEKRIDALEKKLWWTNPVYITTDPNHFIILDYDWNDVEFDISSNGITELCSHPNLDQSTASCTVYHGAGTPACLVCPDCYEYVSEGVE